MRSTGIKFLTFKAFGAVTLLTGLATLAQAGAAWSFVEPESAAPKPTGKVVPVAFETSSPQASIPAELREVQPAPKIAFQAPVPDPFASDDDDPSEPQVDPFATEETHSDPFAAPKPPAPAPPAVDPFAAEGTKPPATPAELPAEEPKTPVKPIPLVPVPAEPTPVEPAPAPKPEPVEPAPAPKPIPLEPAPPVAPVEPAPVEPAPVEPIKPDVAKPAPARRVYSDSCDACGCVGACDDDCSSQCGRKSCLGALRDGRGIEMEVWGQVGGYYNSRTTDRGSSAPLAFVEDPDVQLHQLWFSLYKDAVGRRGNRNQLDWGGRVDYLLGTDAPEIQAVTTNRWDNGWNINSVGGIPYYGSSIPQLYGEIAYGNWSVKAGSMLRDGNGGETIVAKDNFFFSHSYATDRLLPYTYSGLLLSWKASPFLTLSGGWCDGYHNGPFPSNGTSLFLFRIRADLTKKLSAGWTLDYGNLNVQTGTPAVFGEIAIHTLYLEYQLTKRLAYRLDGSYFRANEDSLQPRGEAYSLNNQLYYQVNKRWNFGTRFEWFYDRAATQAWMGDGSNLYACTFGLNWTPSDCLKVRPEIRYDWTDTGGRAFGPDEDDNATTFGVDAILEF